jgi:hypothetical protein
MGGMNTVRAIVLLCIITLASTGCDDDTAGPNGDGNGPVSYEGKKILVVHSYHSEHKGVVENNEALNSVFDESAVEYKIVYMDTQRNTDEDFKKEAALEAKETIEQYQPDVVITVDDNAFKYLIMPYYKDSELPVVFAGIDWDSSVYGAPYTNTTGMISVALATQVIDHLEKHAGGNNKQAYYVLFCVRTGQGDW